MIAAESLTRKYGDFTAVSDVSFAIGSGEIVGLLGHNGAGKTTIMKMLTGYLEPTAGTVKINSINIEAEPEKAKSLIGYLPENCPIYTDMTVIDFLDYAAELRGVGEADRPAALRRAIEATGLAEKATAPISSLSRGYRQRVGVAQAILHKPKIVILDEPTNGLDPSQIKHMRSLIKSLTENATVILSTHILQEVQAICDRVIIVNRGKLAIDSKLAELSLKQRIRLTTNGELDRISAIVNGHDSNLGVEALASDNGRHSYGIAINGHNPSDLAPKIARLINDNGLDLIALHPEHGDLETVFAEITSSESSREAAHA
ncbi:MAG: ABC transporter ATP-binding protein [Hyphomicrobiales bacterium]|nr:ABC transporter ATP-binding protein [Hyphomicrobiales bacterium]